jgi:lipoprotein signal peptidase
MKLKNNIKNFWLGALFVFLFDQSTKIWALKYLPLEEEYLLNQWFSFQRVYNEATVMLNYSLPFGISLNMFRISWVFFAIILTMAIYWVIKQPALKHVSLEVEFAKTGLFLLIGSIWGNAFDRIFRQEGVIDFIRISYFTETIMIYMGDLCFVITWCLLVTKTIHTKVYSQ